MSRKRVNSMTRLLNKIERRLGTEPLNLPEHLAKDKWAEVIKEDSLHTFSLFFPHVVPYTVDTERDKIDERANAFYIDQDLIGEELDVLGMKDITMEQLGVLNNINQYSGEIYPGNHSLGDLAGLQMGADISSMYNSGIFVEFEHPNKIVIEGVNGHNVLRRLPSFQVELLITHSANLSMMSPTVMIEFEKLAILDIKIFLYNGLKHYNNLETVYANIDLMIDDWASAEDERNQLVEEFKDNYVSAANTNQPMFFSI